MKSGNSILAKSYRVAYALFRVAGTLPERSFRMHLEDKALDLIVAALEERQAALRRTVRTVEYLVRFLRDTGHVHVHTADLVLKEVREVEAAIAGLQDGVAAVPAEELFPASPVEAVSEGGRKVTMERNNDGVQIAGQSRRTTILDKIRQSGNLPEGCRLKDLQETLQNVSERTLRYDLQRLIEEGAVTRQGNGGPATYYRVA